MNPVVLLDEVDKVGADYRGDPTAALLEVLDPAQNHTFRDHYLEVELDLSDVLFLATANVLEAIPEPLLDRMELVTPGRLHRGREGRPSPATTCCPGSWSGPGWTPTRSTLTDDALRKLAAEYTREAGVRELERAHRPGAAQGRGPARARASAELPVTVERRRPARLPRPRRGSPPESAERDRGARRGDRAGGDRRRRRRAVHRGVAGRPGDRRDRV